MFNGTMPLKKKQTGGGKKLLLEQKYIHRLSSGSVVNIVRIHTPGNKMKSGVFLPSVP